MKQNSYLNNTSCLYLVPTPIGNLKDMTTRCLDVLNSVDIIACEDTRITKKLLDVFAIRKPIFVNQKYNEDENVDKFITLLDEGKSIALVSDAGMPCISDPGYTIVYSLVNRGYTVIALPGANAALTALMASGINSNEFKFVGFLDATKSGREKQLDSLRQESATLIFYEAVHRITPMLQSCLDVLGNRYCCVARELTKLHECYYRGPLSEVIQQVDVKGEYVVIVEGNHEDISNDKDYSLLQDLIDEGLSCKSATAIAIKYSNLSKNECYAYYKNH